MSSGPGAMKLENLLKSENILKKGNTQILLAENTDLSKKSLLSKEKVLWHRGQDLQEMSCKYL